MSNLNYSQTTGKLTKDDGSLVATGFAGNNSRPGVNPKHLPGYNNHKLQDKHCIGPLPVGVYTVGRWEKLHDKLGPLVAPLTQTSGETFGRDDFFIHGASKEDSLNSSEGCLVFGYSDRLRIQEINPSTITVKE